jgi:hypothetical protein
LRCRAVIYNKRLYLNLSSFTWYLDPAYRSWRLTHGSIFMTIALLTSISLALTQRLATNLQLANLEQHIYGMWPMYHIYIYHTLAKEGPLQNVSPPPTLDSISCYGLRIFAHLEKHSSNCGFMRIELQIVEVRSISNLPNSRRTKPSLPYAAFQHKRTIVHGLAIVILLLDAAAINGTQWSIGPITGCPRSAAIIWIMKITWVLYLGTLLRLTVTPIPGILAHPPV